MSVIQNLKSRLTELNNSKHVHLISFPYEVYWSYFLLIYYLAFQEKDYWKKQLFTAFVPHNVLRMLSNCQRMNISLTFTWQETHFFD
ncbi:hypothetical protein AOB57_001535 [Methanosarcina flavescens]|uniref:Uncharacterized protein n=1 Tax=Methanosarcina flavescens TaxID=1715806 RepID=A0A660HPL4_9EURY|nr:hypothetical protein AOB57_001535 [Methanosarcina flavescens]